MNMTKKPSKKVSDDTNNTTPNNDFNSTDNPSSSRSLTTTTVSSNTSKDNNNNNITDTVDKNIQQQTRVVFSPLTNLDISIDDDIDFDTISSISYKRKQVPTKNSNKKKAVKTSTNTTTTSLNTMLNPDTDNDDETNVEQLKGPSNIWQFAIRSNDKSFAKCTECGDDISTSNWSTTSIRRHLIQVHGKTELILSNTEEKKKPSNIRQELKEKLHNLCVEAIIRDSLPFKAFTNSGLSKVLEEAVPGYKPIHRNTVSRRIKRLKNKYHTKLIDQLKNIESISITTDCWSNRTNNSFIVLTGHFYTDGLNLKSKVLVFSSFKERHTSIQIARYMTSKLRQLNILHKVNRIVCDGAKNLSNAIDLMNINGQRIWCAAHRLHLVVTIGLALWPKKSKKKKDGAEEGEKKTTL